MNSGLTSFYIKSAALLLILSGALLASLIPGGPIETRDFSAIPLSVLILFNLFLTTLGFGSFILALACIYGGRYVGKWVFLAGLSYQLVYLADILGVFPQTPTAMSNHLLVAEITGILLSALLITLAIPIARRPTALSTEPRFKPKLSLSLERLSFSFGIMLVFAAILVIVFASYSAVNHGG